eukprot:COSAG02_NODE_22_length_53020_cov_16.223125_24_plen_191_part_00
MGIISRGQQRCVCRASYLIPLPHCCRPALASPAPPRSLRERATERARGRGQLARRCNARSWAPVRRCPSPAVAAMSSRLPNTSNTPLRPTTAGCPQHSKSHHVSPPHTTPPPPTPPQCSATQRSAGCPPQRSRLAQNSVLSRVRTRVLLVSSTSRLNRGLVTPGILSGSESSRRMLDLGSGNEKWNTPAL